jgi:hypothetical protein
VAQVNFGTGGVNAQLNAQGAIAGFQAREQEVLLGIIGPSV